MGHPSITSIIEEIASAGKSYGENVPGARETLINLGHALVASLEIPSEFIQRSMWGEVSRLLYRIFSRLVESLKTNSQQPCLSAINRMAVDLKLFQYLRDAGAYCPK